MWRRPDITQQGVMWYLSWDCQYSCEYCWTQGWRRSKIKSYWTLNDAQEFTNVLESLMCPPLQHSFSGGEPTAVEWFEEFAAWLLKRGNVVFVNSNMSNDVIVNLAEIGKGLMNINASYQHGFADVDDFINKVHSVNSFGSTVYVSIVLFPPLLHHLRLVKERFDKEGIGNGGILFHGLWNGGSYPNDYTLDDERVLEDTWGIRIETCTPVPTKGHPCRAGKDFITAWPGKNITGCLSSHAESIPNYMGIARPDFKLLECAYPCEVEYCPCAEIGEALRC